MADQQVNTHRRSDVGSGGGGLRLYGLMSPAPHTRSDPAPRTSTVVALHPLGRVGTAVEVADAVDFLLSPAAGFVNGVVLPVDGGRAAHGPDPEAV